MTDRLGGPSGERGVSPVVGVLLTLGIAILLATLVGAAVSSLGTESTEGGPAPQARLVWEYDGGTLSLEHRGGETLERSRLRVVEDGTPASPTWEDGGDGEITAGEGFRLTGVAVDDTVRVLWVDPTPDSDRQLPIAVWDRQDDP